MLSGIVLVPVSDISQNPAVDYILGHFAALPDGNVDVGAKGFDQNLVFKERF